MEENESLGVTPLRLEPNSACMVVGWSERGSLVEFIRCAYKSVNNAVETLKQLPHVEKVIVYSAIEEH